MLSSSPESAPPSWYRVHSPSDHPPWKNYGAVVVCVLIATVLRWALTPLWGPSAFPFLFYIPAVVCVAWYGGGAPAVATIILSMGAAGALFIPADRWHFGNGAWATLLGFAVVSLFVAGAINAMHRANARQAVQFRHHQAVENARRESEARERGQTVELAAIMEAVPAVIWIARDPECRVIEGNKAAHELLRLPPEANLSLSPKANAAPRHFEVWAEGRRLIPSELPMQRAARGEKLEAFEEEIRFTDGTSRHLIGNATPLLHEGVVSGAVAAFVDITERKAMEANARRGEERLRHVLASLTDGFHAIDAEWRYTEFNPRAREIFKDQHLDADALIGRRLFDVFPEHRTSAAGAAQERTMKERVPTVVQNYEASWARWFEVRNYPTPDGGMATFFRDITAERRNEDALREARDAALAAGRAKDDFLAALSHELRTPLNPALLLVSDPERQAQVPAGLQADFATIRRSIELEARLIDDLLDVTAISAGKLKLELAPVTVRHVVENALKILEAEIAAKDLRIDCIFGDGDRIFSGDEVRLQQVFWNVLRNAVKFTPEHGTISVSTRLGEDGSSIRAEVRDTGIGLTSEELGRIFTAFTQGDHTAAKGPHRFGGLGLGLAISRQLVELHGGTVSATSAGRGFGASFLVTLPAKETPAAPAKAPPDSSSNDSGPPRTGLEILLVEDHAATRQVLEQLLRRRGHRVQVAGSLAEARAEFARSACDLLISDIGLPDGTGYELMREFGRDGKIRGIALTGYGNPEDRAAAAAAGFSTHLTKPIHVGALEEALRSVAQTKASPSVVG